MGKQGILWRWKIGWAMGMLMWIVAPAHAVDLDGHELEINVDFTYASKYMWHGFDIFQDHGAFQPSFTLTYEGLYAGVWTSFPDTHGFDRLTEMDFYLGYGYTFFEEDPYAVTASLGYTYFSYPKYSRTIDAQEISLGVSMPNLLPLGPSSLVPSYTAYYDWDGVQSSVWVDDGWYHVFALSYDVPIPPLIPGQESQAITLSGDLTYTDGAFGTKPSWSHSTLGVATTFEWKGIYLTPALYYQFSFEDSVNPEDDLYMTVSIGYTF